MDKEFIDIKRRLGLVLTLYKSSFVLINGEPWYVNRNYKLRDVGRSVFLLGEV